MNIHLTPEQAHLIDEELKAGRFHTVQEVISEALRRLGANRHEENSASANGSRREAVTKMLEFVEKNSVRLEEITVKALIHEGHRL